MIHASRYILSTDEYHIGCESGGYGFAGCEQHVLKIGTNCTGSSIY